MKRQKSACPQCNRRIGLDRKGRIMTHREPPAGRWCAGSLRRPGAVIDLKARIAAWCA